MFMATKIASDILIFAQGLSYDLSKSKTWEPQVKRSLASVILPPPPPKKKWSG